MRYFVVELLPPIEPDEEPDVESLLVLGDVAPDELELGRLDESELDGVEVLLGDEVLPEAPVLEPCFAK